MGVVALMGGNEFREDCIPLDLKLLGMAKQPRRVVIVPTAAAFQNPQKAAENGLRYFQSLGTIETAAMILNRSDADEPANLAQLESADVIYLTGGSPAHLLRTMLGSKAADMMREVFRGGGVIIGSSAGAMVLGEVMRGETAGAWEPALNLVPQIAVRPHHSPVSETDLGSLRQGLKSSVSILGIPTATACIYNGGSALKVLGANPVTVYSNDRVSRHSPGDSFTVATG